MTSIPFDQRDGVIWFDGKLIEWNEAKIHILTHELHYGGAVFEGERSYDGKIFKSTKHSERLINSAELLDYVIPYSVQELDAAKQLVIEQNQIPDAYIRAIAWRGSDILAVGAPDVRIHTAIAAWAKPPTRDFSTKADGIQLDIAGYRRPDPTTAPSQSKAAGLYMICSISKHRAIRRGFSDALMLDWKGRVAECTAANIFFARKDELHTPIADCFLDGMTRRTVIDLANNMGLTVIERRIYPDELENFDEAFVTGSAAEIVPVSKILNNTYKNREIAEAIFESYQKCVREK